MNVRRAQIDDIEQIEKLLYQVQKYGMETIL